MKKPTTGLAAGLVLIAATGTASANEFEPALRQLADEKIKAMVADPALLVAIRAQNAETAAMDEAAIIAADQQWRGEVGGGSAPTIDPELSGAGVRIDRGRRGQPGGRRDLRRERRVPALAPHATAGLPRLLNRSVK